MKIVMKFGGTSLADGKYISHACRLVADSLMQRNHVVVVASAMSKVTDELINICEDAKKGKIKLVSTVTEKLRQMHLEACKLSVEDNTIRREVEEVLKKTFAELENVSIGIVHLKEVTPKTMDYVLSFGERLSAPIVYGVLRSLGIDSQWFTGKDVGIVTDSNFGNASPLLQLTTLQVQNKLQNCLDRNITAVVTGFIAADQHGNITTLGRGGSDYTATILGTALNVDEVWIWSDVDGLMTADPKVEPEAKVIRRLSYNEAMEMAYFGAKMTHPQAIETVMEKEIAVRVRNTFKPGEEGTLICKDIKVDPHSIVKAISLIREAALITISGASMVGTPGTAAKLFGILGEKNINILMISQGSSEANISFIIPRKSLDEALNLLEVSLLGGRLVREIKAEDDVCAIALVGVGMAGTPGVAARVFSAIGREKINIRMIAQGSSELNISFVVKEEDGDRAVRALHREFELER